MGFLKFLKREKKKEFDELDLPPAPPPLEGFEENIPELPEVPEWPSFEEKISAPEMQMPEAKFELPEEPIGEEMPKFSAFEPEEKPSMPMAPAMAQPAAPKAVPEIKAQEPMPEEKPSFMPSIYPKLERRLFAHEKKALREMPALKTIYVRVDKFKATLGNINHVRSDLRKSDEAVIKLESLKNAKDREFDKVKMSLEDLQKKLIFVDKTLFKGDGN